MATANTSCGRGGVEGGVRGVEGGRRGVEGGARGGSKTVEEGWGGGGHHRTICMTRAAQPQFACGRCCRLPR